MMTATFTECLRYLAAFLSGYTSAIERADSDNLRRLLQDGIDRIEVDPNGQYTDIHYRFAIGNGFSMASPRGVEPRLPP